MRVSLKRLWLNVGSAHRGMKKYFNIFRFRNALIFDRMHHVAFLLLREANKLKKSLNFKCAHIVPGLYKNCETEIKY